MKIKEKERAIIEFTCIPDVTIEKATELYNTGFKHLREFLEFTLDDEAKEKGLVDILNYKILSQFLSLKEEEVPTEKFKCPFCKGTVYADEEECSDCGALLLEEILEVETEDVYKGMREMMETVISNPDVAKKFLEGLVEGDDESTAMEMETITKEIGEPYTSERGFVVTSIIPEDEDKNHVIVISPLGEHEEEKKRAFEDFKDLGAGDVESYSIEGGNITNKQEEAVSAVASKFIKKLDFEAADMKSLFILNLKIARFMESKATIIMEDNRPFLSLLDEINPDDPDLTDIMNIVHDAKLIKEIKKISEKFVLDSISFNNDPISFLLAKESIQIFKKENLGIQILDVVVNTNYINQGNHNELVKLLLEWK
ncbi:MAG: hypothetical protein JSV09_02575 [Thermoplasmata archaeon]|nr:MAG: hypothetical protein JSV09_02575 [Thermoplasmata archaeon]